MGPYWRICCQLGVILNVSMLGPSHSRDIHSIVLRKCASAKLFQYLVSHYVYSGILIVATGGVAKTLRGGASSVYVLIADIESIALTVVLRSARFLQALVTELRYSILHLLQMLNPAICVAG